jgi:carboxypeptidase Taq
MAVKEEYNKLVEMLEERSHLGGVMGVMHWDQEVIMPSGAAESRAKQMSALAGVLHEKSTAPEFGELVDRLHGIGNGSFNIIEWCNIEEAKREYDLETKVPKKLVQELAELSSRGHVVWVQARKDNRFADFAPVLQRFIELKTQWAKCVFPDLNSYDANIDIFERGSTQERIDPIFATLKKDLIALIQTIQSSGSRPDNQFLQGNFPVVKQKELGRKISKQMGFSFEEGRLDVSVHPFCGGAHPTDVRITTRYRSDNFVESLYAVIHETGHGLYEQGRMQEGWDLPVSEPLTMGIHESQSLFWERMIAQSRSFCSHFLPLFQSVFEGQFDDVSGDQLYDAVNTCEPSLIRVEADEITYPLHIILRYEMEKGLFDGSIQVNDLPEIWNDKMDEYLGVRPPSDTLGVLQDVHWSSGSFGYFPSYTLGAIYACQFFNAMKKEIPDIEEQIAQGHLHPVKDWLNKNIHCLGRLYSVEGLVKKVTGEPLNPHQYMRYLKEKYATIYKTTLG